MYSGNKKVFFIGGSSYSGSTMLDMMIANTPEGFSMGEVYAMFRPYRPNHFVINPKCSCGDPNCDIWAQVRKAGEKRLYETIFQLMPNIDFVVDSSKDPWWISEQSDYLKSQGVKVFHLLIWKEPAAFAYSMLKRKRRHWKSFWKNYYKLYFSLIKDYFAIPYSELVQYPDIVLHDICNKAGLAFHKGREKYWMKKHHTLFGNDSAKVHLYDKKNKIVQRYNDTQVDQGLQSNYRSIYYDTNYLKLLPDEILRDIENDLELNKIISALQNKGYPPKELCWPPTKIELRRRLHAVKAFIGKILGRYWQLF